MGGIEGSSQELADYLVSHTTNETWILAVPSSQQAASLIIETGKPVMCLGGFSGSDQALDLASFQEYVRNGKVRYVQTGGNGGGGMGGSNSEIFSWVSATCTLVTISSGNSTGTGSTSLYDCAGAVSSA